MPIRSIIAGLFLLAAIVIGIYVVRGRSRHDAVGSGLNALHRAYRQHRLVDIRISGFEYAPLAGEQSSFPPGTDKSSLDAAQEILLRESLDRPNAESLQALGQYYLAGNKYDEAISEFEKAKTYRRPSAQLLSDLGAAWIEKGNSTQEEDSGASLDAFGRAIDLLDRALELDGSLAEARFNRALCMQSMALFQSSADGWRRYVKIDSSSGWGAEAKSHLQLLESQLEGFHYDHDLAEHFVEFYRAGNKQQCETLLRLSMESITGNVVWWQLLGRYLNSSTQGRVADAKNYMDALGYAGKLEAARGDRYVDDIVHFYGGCSSAGILDLSHAHELIDDANSRCLVDDINGALGLYTEAEDTYARAGSPEKYMAGYWMAYCRFRQSRVAEAYGAALVLADQCRSSTYLWLSAQTTLLLSGMASSENKHSESFARQAESLSAARSIGDAYDTQKNLDQAAYEFKSVGNTGEAAARIWLCVISMRDGWTGDRQFCRNYDTAAQVMGALGYYAAAAEYAGAALRLAVEKTNDPGVADFGYQELATIASNRGLYSQALEYAGLSSNLGQAISDLRTRQGFVGRTELRSADAYRGLREYSSALAHYDGAIAQFGELNLPALLYEAHKGRLLCYLAQGDDSKSEQELSTVLNLFERYWAEIRDERNRDSFFDLDEGVYEAAIDFEYSRKHDYLKALQYSEDSRARSLLETIAVRSGRSGAARLGGAEMPAGARPFPVSEITTSVPAQCQIVEYSVLADKTLIWVISHGGVQVAESAISSAELTSMIGSFSKMISSPENSAGDSHSLSVAIYNAIFAPIAGLLDKRKQIVIVPDKALNFLPFGALISPATGNYLISDYLFSLSPSSSVFLRCSMSARSRSAEASETVLSVGDPAFDKSDFPRLPELPDSGREAQGVARCYASAILLTGQAATKRAIESGIRKSAVVHIASHYLVDPDNPEQSELVTAAPSGSGTDYPGAHASCLTGADIYNLKMPTTRLVVLSACRTALDRYYRGEGMVGMSRTFLADRVPLVVATLWQVASDPAADLMIDFHRRRTRDHLSTVAALQQAQLNMMASGDSRLHRPYYWAGFVAIGGYASF